MDATDTPQAVVVGICTEAWTATLLAGEHPQRAQRPRVLLAGFAVWRIACPSARVSRSTSVRETYEGWAKENRHYWLSNYRDFLEFFFSQALDEPHSTKQIEDSVGWGLETDPQTLLATVDAPEFLATLTAPRPASGGALSEDRVSGARHPRRERPARVADARRSGRASDRRRARRHRGRRPCPVGPPAGQDQSVAARLR